MGRVSFYSAMLKISLNPLRSISQIIISFKAIANTAAIELIELKTNIRPSFNNLTKVPC